MQEVLFLGFPHISIITAVVTGSFVGAILLFRFHFTLILLIEHCGINDWEIILVDKERNKQETWKKELFWQYKLDTFVPHGLSERVVDLEWI